MKRVMLVEDEELILQGIRYINDWQSMGMQVIHMAHNGIEALEMLKKQSVDIIVTDIEMPEMNGIELISNVRQSDNRVRFLILSEIPYLPGLSVCSPTSKASAILFIVSFLGFLTPRSY